MSKVRLYEIAKELGKESKEVVARAKELGLDVKSHSSSVEADAGERIKSSFKKAAAPNFNILDIPMAAVMRQSTTPTKTSPSPSILMAAKRPSATMPQVI